MILKCIRKNFNVIKYNGGINPNGWWVVECLEQNTMQEEGSNPKTEVESSARPAPPPVHPAIQPLSYLLGTWRGQGEGGFPTINSFSYGEELVFSHSGKVLLILFQMLPLLSRMI